MSNIELSEAEIKRITGYTRPAYQMKVLRELGIRARRRPDNSILVLRMDCTNRHATPEDEPKLNFA